MFVIQKHEARQLHYDVRLECDGVLKSWAVPKGPSLNPADKRLAVMVEDHPFEYASFEGVIPKGQYGAGEVIVWDCGLYSPDEGGHWFDDRGEAERRTRDELKKGKLSLLLRGEKVKGSFALVRTSDGKSWLLIKHKDRFVSSEDPTQLDRSVLSGLTNEEVKTHRFSSMPASRLVPVGPAEAFPASLSPMLAELRDAAFNDPEWMWEPKLDGYRVLACIDGETVRLRSRGGLEFAPVFPSLVRELRGQSVKSLILDGELVALDANGRPSFAALQKRAQLKTEREIAAADRNEPVALYCFDLLHFAGLNLRDAPYHDRRRWLSQCLLPSSLVRLVHTTEDGLSLLDAALNSGFEGVVGKRRNSVYQAGRRSSSWIKVKLVRSAEFVVGGYTQGKGARAPLGALLVGYFKGSALHYASHVGSGFDDRTLADVKARLEALRIDACPFVERPDLTGPTTWVKPELVAEVKFHEWTGDGRLRAPVFLRLRDDLDPKKVRLDPGRLPAAASGAGRASADPSKSSLARNGGRAPDPARPSRSKRASTPARVSGASRSDPSGRPKGASAEIADVLRQLENPKAAFTLSVGPHQVRLTHLDRVYWPADPALRQPALTKRDLLRYFAEVSPYIITHLADRPLTMIRMPEGILGQRFFQKHWEQAKPDFAETITVFSEHKDESHDYLLCNNLPTLLWLAQSGTLEFHVWHSRSTPGPDAATSSTDFATSADSMEGSILNYPDYVVFDIDPYIYSGKETPGQEPELNTLAFEKGKEVAFRVRELLNEMSLEPIVKTSGKTGLHVFLPIRRTIDFDSARKVCEMVGRHLVRRYPGEITLEWSVPKRTGKIFFDYNMNVRGKTLNVAYSPRGVAGAPASMPVTWEELAEVHPLDFRITNVAQRLSKSGDRWRDALKKKQSLERSLERTKVDRTGR